MPSSCILQLCVWHDETPKLELLADPPPKRRAENKFGRRRMIILGALPLSCIYCMWVWHDGNSNLELSSTSPSRRRRHGGGTKSCSLSFKKIKRPSDLRKGCGGEALVEGGVAERNGSIERSCWTNEGSSRRCVDGRHTYNTKHLRLVFFFQCPLTVGEEQREEQQRSGISERVWFECVSKPSRRSFYLTARVLRCFLYRTE